MRHRVESFGGIAGRISSTNLKMIDARASERVAADSTVGTAGSQRRRGGERMTECLGGFWVTPSLLSGLEKIRVAFKMTSIVVNL